MAVRSELGPTPPDTGGVGAGGRSMMETSCELEGDGAMRCNAELAAALRERRRGGGSGAARRCVSFFYFSLGGIEESL